MKILILTNNSEYTYNLRRELIQQLIFLGNEVHISCYFSDKYKELKNLGAHLINTKFYSRSKNPFSNILLIFTYLKLIIKIKPVKILTFTMKPNIYGGLLAKLFKIDYYANITGFGSVFLKTSLLKEIVIILMRNSLNNASKIYCQNVEIYNFFNKLGFNKNSLTLINGSGVNLKEFSYFRFPKSTNVKFIFYGRLIEEKGLFDYLEAGKRIMKTNKYVEFHVLGRFTNKIVKAKAIQAYPKIFFHEHTNNVIPFLQSSHCIVLPSYYPEGISNSLLEGAAIGRPIITTNVTGCKEVVENNVNGFLVIPRNIDDLYLKLQDFLRLDHHIMEKMGEFSRLKVEKVFDRDIIVKTYINDVIVQKNEDFILH
jgi:glycosyltransferase involved in cell wall biosynthesis